MLKYQTTQIVFREVPDEITLAINISNCPIHCEGCHSPELWEDKGTILSKEIISKLIEQNKGITCISFMGGDSDPNEIQELAKYIKTISDLKVCWYSGKTIIADFDYSIFDYIKTGRYIKGLGGLDSPNSNQKFYKVVNIYNAGISYFLLEDITYKFKELQL